MVSVVGMRVCRQASVESECKTGSDWLEEIIAGDVFGAKRDRRVEGRNVTVAPCIVSQPVLFESLSSMSSSPPIHLINAHDGVC
jgi:hypothetical protein